MDLENCKAYICRRCKSDQSFLQRKRRPKNSNEPAGSIRVVDLFSGCGGMSVGLEEAARRAGLRLEIPLAVDTNKDVIAIYKANFPYAKVLSSDVGKLFNGAFGAPLTSNEKTIIDSIGQVDILIGGPPCQGHSDLNNHTRRRDPKNGLYLRMARAAEVLKPRVVVIENVAQVQLDKTRVVRKATKALIAAGYQVAGCVVDLRRVGVPQRRRRFILLASKLKEVLPDTVLKNLAEGMPDHPDRTVRWAIHDLLKVKSRKFFDTASTASKKNRKRIAFLFKNGLYDLPNKRRPECHQDGLHSYVSMYGRLRWDSAAQTITTGFGSPGQGRYIHPARQRTITPHEAARLQTFPDWYDFGGSTSRGVLATIIGNAVPPILMTALGNEIMSSLND